MMQATSSLPSARVAFWIAVAIGALALAAAYINPLAGAVSAALFFLTAWGIRRGQALAAVALVYLLVQPPVTLIARGFSIQPLAITILLTFALACLPLRAAIQMRRSSGVPQRPWLWAVFLLVNACFWVGFSPYMMNAGSMERTVLAGDCVLTETATWRLGRAPRMGDLVTFRYPVDRNQVFLKRVVGLPGDRLRIVNQQLYRNGVAVPEPYVSHTTTFVDAFRDNFPSNPSDSPQDLGWKKMLGEDVRGGEVIVPGGKYFVLGDNRDNSLDSRYWGFISRGDILGSPVLIYASYDVKGEPNSKAPNTAFNTRWNRLLRAL